MKNVEKTIVKVSKRINYEHCDKINVEITVSDCFSITGTMWHGEEIILCGCIHDKILEHFPELKVFTELHLNDINSGLPLNFIEDSIYHIKKKNVKSLMYYGFNENQVTYLINENVVNVDDFMEASIFFGVIDRWLYKRDIAIEKFSGMYMLQELR